MFIYTRLSAPKRFAKFGWQTRAICHKEYEKSGCQTSPTDCIATEIFVRPDADPNGNYFSYVCATYQPNAILITFCHLYLHIYSMLADFYAQKVS